MTTARLISQLRHASALSQAELARRSGIPRTAINAYERGHRIPTSDTLLRLAEASGAQLKLSSKPRLDLKRNARVLEEVLDLAEQLPARRRSRLTFPRLPS